MLHGMIVAVLAASVVTAEQAWAQSDISGSTDPLNIARFPHAWIVEYEADDESMEQ